MERLTKRIEGGQAVFHECHGTCGTCDGANCYCIGPMVDRLAAYEDSGLEPEEIERIVDAYGRGHTLRTESAERLEIVREIKTDRLRELVQAEQDGRLHITPAFVWHNGDSGLHKVPYKPWMEKWIATGTKFWLTREEAEATLAKEGGAHETDSV